MSRENKFRGKRIDDDNWVYGYLVRMSYRVWIKDVEDKYTNPRSLDGINHTADIRCVEVDPATVGQYIGLKDKAGEQKERYEGDILGWWEDERWCVYGYIKYCDEPDCIYAGRYYLADKDGDVSDWWEDDWSETGGLEVIGNIHDNPSLLKEF